MTYVIRFHGIDTHEVSRGRYVAANAAIVSPATETVELLDGAPHYPDRITVWDNDRHFPGEMAEYHSDAAAKIAARRTAAFLAQVRKGDFVESPSGTFTTK